MSALRGNMLKIFGVLAGSALLYTTTVTADSHDSGGDEMTSAAAYDVRALVNAARGSAPLICSMAAQSVGNGNWGGWSDAPTTPLASVVSDRESFDRNEISVEDLNILLESLASEDACVREISVRLLGRSRHDAVTTGLLSRLSAPAPQLREVAALGLGLVHPARAVEPLVSALRDASAAVRANSAWALGRIENGRALKPLLEKFTDEDAKVREAAVGAVGRIDSTSSVPAQRRA
jgi:HEAT repeat protein